MSYQAIDFDHSMSRPMGAYHSKGSLMDRLDSAMRRTLLKKNKQEPHEIGPSEKRRNDHIPLPSQRFFLNNLLSLSRLPKGASKEKECHAVCCQHRQPHEANHGSPRWSRPPIGRPQLHDEGRRAPGEHHHREDFGMYHTYITQGVQ